MHFRPFRVSSLKDRIMKVFFFLIQGGFIQGNVCKGVCVALKERTSTKSLPLCLKIWNRWKVEVRRLDNESGDE